jgi:DNA helicase II / ATP-dependent DNA helicase PcrA
MPFEPNQYQTAVFESLKSRNNKVVRARAGTGKTTTIIQALSHIPVTEHQETTLTAFNKSIQKELETRAPSGIAVKTLHSIGYGCLRKQGRVELDDKKTSKIVSQFLKFEDDAKGRYAALLRLIGLAKNMLLVEDKEIEAAAYAFGIEDSSNPADVLASQTKAILKKCTEDLRTIDFDDMIWLPAVLDLKPKTYSTVFVDEAQDLNRAQLWLIEQIARNEGRLIAVGDDRQAIYRWRGAGESVIEDIIDASHADVLPLSITYRCPKKVVELARRLVPDYQAAPTAPDGDISELSNEKMLIEAAPGDFILSRRNAPLMPICLALLSQGKPAQVAGRDIGKGLLTLLGRFKSPSIKELMVDLEEFKDHEHDRLMPDHHDAYAIVCDKVECLKALAEGENCTADIAGKVERLFSDTDTLGRIVCSTVHKAKGLERKRVMLLADTFTVGKKKEEDNIYYVAITRSQGSLVFVR